MTPATSTPANDNPRADTWDGFWARLARNRQERIDATTDPVEKARLQAVHHSCGVVDQFMSMLRPGRKEGGAA